MARPHSTRFRLSGRRSPRSGAGRRLDQRLLPGLTGLVLLGLGGLVVPAAGAGEITASGGSLSLDTQVNGVTGGSCTAGDCAIGGGTRAGANLFHRFSAFDSRGGIRSVLFDTQGQRALVVGVTSPLGTVLDKPVAFSAPAALIWLSPGGISLGAGVSFTNIPDLRLSTATGLRVGGGLFDVMGTTAAQAAQLSGEPLAGRAGLVSDPASLAAASLSANGDVTLASGLLTVDHELLLDAQGGHVLLQGGQIQAPGGSVELVGQGVTVGPEAGVNAGGPAGGGVIRALAGSGALEVAGTLAAPGEAAGAVGGRLELSGASVALRGARLDASGPAGGGTVLVGGGQQGRDASLPNAQSTLVDGASAIRADATAAGRGGTVVVWGEQQTSFAGTTSARGGPKGGDGGFLELSSRGRVHFSGTVDAAAPAGKAGSVLFDPENITIGSYAPGDFLIEGSLQFSGDAAWDPTNKSAVLTQSSLFQAGSIFSSTALPLGDDASFSTVFQFKISEPQNGGADGIAFVVRNSKSATLGASGGYLGYLGINNSLGIEFDTYSNPEFSDPNESHLGVNLNGSVVSKATATVAPNLSNGEPWTAWIDYNDITRTLDVRLANNSATRPDSPTLSYALENQLKDIIGVVDGSSLASFGITAATGGSTNKHEILAWSMAAPSSVNGSLIGASTISDALNSGTNVILSTSGGGTQAGDITVAAPISKSAGGDAALTLNAHNTIALNADISSGSGRLNLNLNPDSDANGSGATSLASGATLALNGGTATFNGTTTLAGTISGSTLSKTGGSAIAFSGASLSDVTIGSDLNTTGLLFLNGAATTLANGITVNWLSDSWHLNSDLHTIAAPAGGTATINMNYLGGNSLSLQGALGAGAQLTIGSGIKLQGDGVIDNWPGSQLINRGTILATKPGTFLALSTSTLVNEGTIGSTDGSLELTPATTFTNAGTLSIGPGGVRTFGRSIGNAAAGTILGAGSLDLGSGTLTNAGTISPGGAGAAGTLTINGNLALEAGSQLQLELLGSGATPSGNDKLVVNGGASLGGSLSVSSAAGYLPPAGFSADLGTASDFAASSGSFSSTSLPSGFTGAVINPPAVPVLTYRISNGPPPCAGVCWDGGGGADNRWSTAANWVNDAIPGGVGGSADVVFFDLVSPTTITLNDSRTIAALFSSASNRLSIVGGGSLTLLGGGGGSALNGGLELLAGGTLRVEGAGARLSGGFSQEGGTLGGAGSLTLQGYANRWQGGSWGGGGVTAVDAGGRLLIGSLDTATNPTLLNGRDLSVASSGRLELASDLEVQGGSNTLSLAPGARLAFTNGLGGYPGLLVHAGRLNLDQAGSLQVESNVNAQLGTTAHGAALRWTATGPTQIDDAASLSLYTRPYGADLASEGVVASLGGPVTVAAGSSLASTSSNLTITPLSAADFQFDGTLTVNAGTTSLATAAVPTGFLGGLRLLDGQLGLEGPLQVTGDLAWSGGTIGGDAMARLATAGTSQVSGGGLRTTAVPWTNLASGTITLDGTGLQAMRGLLNDGRVVLNSHQSPSQGDASIRIPSGQTFENRGSFAINSTTTHGGWSLVSNPASQDGIFLNQGRVSLNSGYSSWEIAFSNDPAGSVTLAPETVLSVQNGKTLAGRFSLGSGSTLWLSERHGADAVFSGATLEGPGTLQVLGSGPVVRFDAATVFGSPSAAASELPGLNLGSGGTVWLEGPARWSRFSQSGGVLAGSGSLEVLQAFSRSGGSLAPTLQAIAITQASGDLQPGALTAAGPLSLRAQAGRLTLSGDLVGSRISAAGATGLSLAPGARLQATASSGVSIQLASGSGPFRNEAGSSALNPVGGATWQLYTPSALSPGQILGGLSYAFKQYGKAFGDATPVAGTGHGLFHAQSPVLTVALVGGITKVYDGSLAAPPAAGGPQLQVAGVLPGDTVSLRLPANAAPAFDTPQVGSGKRVVLAGVGVAGAAEGTIPVFGYQLAGSSASGAIGTITPAPLTLRAASETRGFDGTNRSSGLPFISAGQLQGTDALLNLSQRFASPQPLGPQGSTLLVNPGFRLLDGNGGANYAVTLESAAGTITPAAAAAVVSSQETSVFNPATATVGTTPITGFQGQPQGGLAAVELPRPALVVSEASAGLDPQALGAFPAPEPELEPPGPKGPGRAGGPERRALPVGSRPPGPLAARPRSTTTPAAASTAAGASGGDSNSSGTGTGTAAAPRPGLPAQAPGPAAAPGAGSGGSQRQAGTIVVTDLSTDPTMARGSAGASEARSEAMARQLGVALEEDQGTVLSPEQVQQLLQRAMQGMRSGVMK